jgi:4-amino-4-deoxy-L-arabinose transferase-like glycosyltransferase
MRLGSKRWILPLILLAGLLLRLAVLLPLDPMDAYRPSGGDALWYMVYGLGFFSGQEFGVAHGHTFTTSNIPTAPLYLIFTGLPQVLLPMREAVLMIWLIQVLASLATCYLAYRITLLLADQQSAWIAAAALAFSPSFVIEPSSLMTETLYIFFIVAGLWLYVEYALCRMAAPRWKLVMLAGAAFGLATLTRPVSILFPVGIVLHALIAAGRTQWKRGLLLGLLLLLSHALITSSWTIHNWFNYGRFVVGSTQLMPAIWRGAVDQDASPQQNDQLLGGQSYSEQAAQVVAEDLSTYLQRRLQELGYSVLQPHGTIAQGRDGLKELLLGWVRSGLTLDGLLRLVNGEGFWIKLLIYVWHYVALLGACFGVWLQRSQWRISLLLLGFIAYTLLIHLVLLALPRYIYPTYPLLWMLAAPALLRLWQFIRRKKTGTAALPSLS